VDEALCFGWIDGMRYRIDEMSYRIRFTPRKPKSVWSNVNVQRVAALKKLGRMAPAGLAAFAKADPKRSGVGSLVSADRHVLGRQREAGRDAAQAADHAHRHFGYGAKAGAAHPAVSVGTLGSCRSSP